MSVVEVTIGESELAMVGKMMSTESGIAAAVEEIRLEQVWVSGLLAYRD